MTQYQAYTVNTKLKIEHSPTFAQKNTEKRDIKNIKTLAEVIFMMLKYILYFYSFVPFSASNSTLYNNR